MGSFQYLKGNYPRHYKTKPRTRVDTRKRFFRLSKENPQLFSGVWITQNLAVNKAYFYVENFKKARWRLIFLIEGQQALVYTSGMRNLSASDFYQIRGMAMMGDAGLTSLLELYFPLLGARSAGLYLAFHHEARRRLTDQFFPHESLFLKTGMTPGEFAGALSPLEALGLLRTYLDEGKNGQRIYIYEVYAPFSPRKFLGTVVLSGLLRNALGDEAYEEIRNKYEAPQPVEGVKDVSMSFREFFHPELDDPMYAKSAFSPIRDGPARLKLSFDYRTFCDVLGQLGLRGVVISDEDLGYVREVASLYGLPPETMAEFAFDVITIRDGKYAVIDRQKMDGQMRNAATLTFLRRPRQKDPRGIPIDSESQIAQKVRFLQTKSPVEYLCWIQGLNQPAPAEVKLVDELHMNMGLSNAAVNALIDWTLNETGGDLPAALIKKMAAMLVRKKAHLTALDAMQCLNDSTRKRREIMEKKEGLLPVEKEPESDKNIMEESEKDEVLSDEEMEARWKQMFANE